MSLLMIQALITAALVVLLILYKSGFFERFSRSRRSGFGEKIATVGGNQLWYLEGANEGPTVLLLHGFAGDKELWMDLSTQMVAKGYRVLAPDLPGFGNNLKDSGTDYSPTTITKQMRGFSRALRLEGFHIVGHSIGATIAASYAYASPAEVLSLTLIEPLGVRVPYESDLDKMIAKGRNPLLVTVPSGYDAMLKFVTARPPEMKAKLKQHRAESLAQDHACYRQAWQQLREGERANLLDLLLPETTKPTLAIFGARSRVVHESTQKMVETMMREKDVRTVVIPGCGHLPMAEYPEKVAEILVSFFQGKMPRLEPA